MLPVSQNRNDIPFIRSVDLTGHVTWSSVADAIAEGHRRDQPKLGDVLLEEDGNSCLTRTARIRGLGMLVKTASVYPVNQTVGIPTVEGAAILFHDKTGSVGVVAGDLARAYSEGFALDRIQMWNRSGPRAEALRKALELEGIATELVDDLEKATSEANLIAAETMSREPLIHGEWVRLGTHVDLVGEYTLQMRESDDALILNSQVFVDCRLTTESQTVDMAAPINSGVFSADRLRGSLYSMVSGQAGRDSDDIVTVFKMVLAGTLI